MAAPVKKDRTVLIAMDGSKHAIYAFEWFMRNVYKADDFVLMAYCTEVPTAVGSLLKDIAKPGSASSIMEKNETASRHVMRIVDGLVKKYNVPHYKFMQLPHPAGEAIVKAAKENHAVFIIAGSRGNNAVRHTIMGSVAKFLVAHGHMPVFICKHKDEQKRLK